MRLSVREMKMSDCALVVDYFVNATPEYILGMGAYPDKLPERQKWIKKLELGFDVPIKEKEFYFIIWQIDNIPVGHSTLNEIKYGHEARMHLHIWTESIRRQGYAAQFLAMTIPFYFDIFHLQKIICEPYALNPAPLNTLKKVGFEFIETHETTPGWINFEQSVNRFELDRTHFFNTSKT